MTTSPTIRALALTLSLFIAAGLGAAVSTACTPGQQATARTILRDACAACPLASALASAAPSSAPPSPSAHP